MIRRLCQRSLTIQNLVLVHLHQEKLCQPRHFCAIKHSLEVPVRKIQQLTYCTIRSAVETEKGKTANDHIKVEPITVELQKRLQCSLPEATEIYQKFSKNGDPVNLDEIETKVKFLSSKGATTSVIVKNHDVLSLPLDSLQKRFEVLNRRKWRRIDDFVPLLAIGDLRIRKIQILYRSVIRDRVYILTEYFSMEPHIISYYCAKHPFVFELELDLLKRKLDMLLSYEVSPENILRDLSVLARAEDVIKKRLDHLKLCGINRIMPWMIKCQEKVLNRTIVIRENMGDEPNRTMEVLTTRLNWHGKAAIGMFRKHKFLNSLSSAMVSELLDELLTVLSPSQISEKIQLLDLPLPHVRVRVAQLTAFKDGPISPELLSMGDKSFKRHVEHAKEK